MPISLNGNGQVAGVAAFDTPTLTINETNNRVGIGTTTPITSLQVLEGEIKVTTTGGNEVTLGSDGNIEIARAGDSPYIDFKNSASEDCDTRIQQLSNGLALFTGGSGSISERMRIDSSGNVGIGTNSPQQKLTINASSGESTLGIKNSGSASSWLVLDPGASGSAIIHNISSVSPTTFTTNGTERMRIDSSGMISINGATESDKRLHLINTTNIHGFFSRNSFASVSGYENFYAWCDRAANSTYSFFRSVSGGSDTEHLLRGDGTGLCDGTWTGGGADYAEYFEWLDGNPNNEDRRGIVVTLEGDKIKPAEEGDTIIGAISGNPSVIGDAAWNKWHEKYLRDDYGTYIFEDYDVLQWVDEEGNEKAVDADGPDASNAPEDATVVIQQRRKLNPAYDPDVEYISRENRPEWDCVGLMGKLRIRRGQPVKDSWIKMKDISNNVEEWLVV